MKKLFALLAVVLAVVSCQKDAGLDVNVGGEQLVNITVALPEATRASSGAGFDLATLGTDFELRYILEIYVEGNTEDCIRKELFTTATENVVFPVRLVAGQNRNYRIVAWADIVPADANRTEDGDYDYYYETSEGLDQILINEAKWTAMKEQRDAYTAFKVVNNFSANSVINLTLKRPFAKVRVVSTDIKNFEDLGYKLSEGSVNYTVELNRQYNALYGTASNAAAKTHTFAYPTPYSKSGDAYETETQRTLFADYIFVDNIEEQDAIRFNLDIKDQFGANLNTIPFNTDIALYANTLTTIIGEVLTEGGKVEVDVNGDFNKPDYTYEVVDVETPEQLQEALENTEVGEIILQENITLDGSLVFGAPATTASTFATRANTDLPGRNITIDGNGKTLKVVKAGTGRVIDFTKETNGASLTLKNLTIENNVSWIERIVNYNTNGSLTLENVKIINAEGCKLNYAINLPAYSDNAKVVIKDSEIWANANALNLWGENTVANITNSKLYVVDSNNIEGYSVVALNNGGENAAHNSIINVEGGEIKVKYEGEGATKPSSALRDATNGSEVYISEETVVVGDIIYPVAILTYKNTTDFYSFTTLQDAIDKAKGDANVDAIRLIKDVEATKVIEISDNVTIDGNGKTISTSDNRIVRITESNDKVTISNVNFVSSAVMNYPSDVRGVSIDPSLSNVELTLNNCSIDFTDKTTNDWTYAVNIAGNGTGHKVIVNGGTYEGANVINAWGANNTITVKNATLNSLYPDSTLYCGVCISTLNCQGTSVYAEGNTFNGKNAMASDLGTGNTLDAKNNTDNTTLFVANGLYKDTNKAYVVTNAAGLVALSGMTIKGNEIVTLGANIDLKGVEFNGLNAFNPENNNTFDGKDFTVSNWTNNSGASDMGFIKNWVGPIKNVKFDNCHLKTSGHSAIVAAKVYGNIENVEVKNSSIEDSYWACGIIAGLYNNGNISNCTVMDSSVKSNGGTSAIVGVINETSGKRNLTNCSVTNCTINNTGAYGESYSGGALVGMFNVDNTTYSIEGCIVSNNTLVGSHVFEKYPANENVIEE